MTKKRTVLVASTGGHLSQLIRLRDRVEVGEDPLWVTFDHPQSRTLLQGEDVVYVPYIASRDLRATLACLPKLFKVIRRDQFDRVISTGAALSVPAFVVSALKGIRRTYIESVSRFDGPSLSGRIVSKIPGTELFTQHERWADKDWKIGPSVLDEYTLSRRDNPRADLPLRVFVTLGTIRPYRFDRLVDDVCVGLPTDAEVIWQLGMTTRDDLPGRTYDLISGSEMDTFIGWADVVITHAGVGSALNILDHGKTPVLAVRRARFGEHVDDHQEQIARELVARGIAFEMVPSIFDANSIASICEVEVRSQQQPDVTLGAA